MTTERLTLTNLANYCNHAQLKIIICMRRADLSIKFLASQPLITFVGVVQVLLTLHKKMNFM